MICSYGVFIPLPDVQEETTSSRGFFFPTTGANTSPHGVPTYMEEALVYFREAYAEAQHQSHSEANQKKCNYDKAISTV